MSREEYRSFVKKSESLVKPVDSTAISFLGDFNKYLPIKMQRKIMEKGAKNIPYMGFIVDPYCFFLAYAVKDKAQAARLLPEAYELADTAIFEGDEKQPLVVISAFQVRTSVFTGLRLECYLIARHKETGRMAWIITDYETNTLSHDPKQGFCGYSCDSALFTITPYAEILAEAINNKNGNRYRASADISKAGMRALDQDLWVEGNLLVDYGGKLQDPVSRPFSLIFDPVLMKEALDVNLKSVEILENTLMGDLIEGQKPLTAAVFPYSQHFIIRQDSSKPMATTEDLLAQMREFLDRKGFKTMAGSDITKPLFRSLVISTLVNAGIIISLLVKIFFFS